MTRRAVLPGFTLIEVLVALLVLGLGVGALLPRLSQAVLAADRAAKREKAVHLAEGILARAGLDFTIIDGGERQGRSGDFTWRLYVGRVQTLPTAAIGVQLAQIKAEVTWSGPLSRQSVTLATHRLVGGAP